MTTTLTLRKIGGSLGFILPKSAVDALSLHEGDEVHYTVSADSLTITPYDPQFAEVLDDAREFMRTHREMFRELAK